MRQIRSYDMFGIPIALNAAGEETINSMPGAIVSLCIMVLMAAYAISQGLLVLERDSDIKNALVQIENNEYYNFAENNMMVAFEMKNTASGEFLTNTSFVTWRAYQGNYSDETTVELDWCTD